MTSRTHAPPGRLPGGRRASGGLTPAEVTAHQRRRMLEAMAKTVATKGFPAATVADVIAAAGVSRATFYQQFDDVKDCFLAAFDAASQHVTEALREVGTTDFDRLLATYLDVLAEDLPSAKVFLVDILSLGTEGIRRRAASQQRFAAMVAAMVGARTAADRLACEAFVAAVSMMVTTRIAGDSARLRALRVPLVKLASRMLNS